MNDPVALEAWKHMVDRGRETDLRRMVEALERRVAALESRQRQSSTFYVRPTFTNAIAGPSTQTPRGVRP